ncbi:MAG: beta-aspartyl-peptidase, partial [Nitrospirae bacterium]
MVHGGAGQRAMTAPQQACLAAALVAGHEVLRHGASSVEAVEKTIR